ncbi:MAG: ABC transporter substrate-binding protein [Anaerolineales bacterium]|nr:ABC transporter substrate-binding protein [Chloroflexota bacterium]MBL6980534.1 ABC transporter substrate-binding protein [Anaerolineales bacterium]
MAIITNLIMISMFAACQPLTSETGRPTAAPTPEQVTQQGEEPKPGGTLIFSFGAGNPRHFNPALLSGSATVIPGAQIFASPLRYDENWNPQPYLAQSWDVSEDGLSITLNLVKGATFHDGEPITSADVAFSVMTVQQHHPFKTMFAPVTGVDTPDPQTAIIRLSQPHPAILMAMSPAFLPILPEHIYGDGQDIPTHPANLEPVGSGPFKFVSFEPGKRIVMERFEDYFLPDRPYLDRIEFWIELNPASQVVSLTRQDAQITSPYLNLDGLDQLKKLGYFEVTQQGYEGIGAINWLAFNLLREPLHDVRVRQAIAYAIDLDFVTQYLHQDLSIRAPSPIIPESPFFEPDLPKFVYDPQKAADLLDQAGYPLSDDGVRFSLTLDYIPVLPTQQHDVAHYIQNQLKDIGIEVQVRDSASFPEWAQRIGEWDFDMTMDAVFNWGDPVIGVHRTYISENIRQGVVWSNTQNYSNPLVDEILAQAAIELDAEKRKSLYGEFQKIVAEELPVIWINELPNHTIYHEGLGNPPLTIWGVHSPLDEVFWQNPPEFEYVAPPTFDVEGSYEQIVLIGIRAIRLLQENDFYTARERLHNPNEGFLDLDDSGLHLIGLDKEGIIFLDNSEQLVAGIDISALLDTHGELVLPKLVEAAEISGLEHIYLEGVWPHPSTQALETVSVWCGMLTSEDFVCALAWIPLEE